MPFTLTAAERASLEAELDKKTAQLNKYTEIEPILQDEIDDKTLQDDGYKKLFEYYDGDVIQHYADERESLDGNYVDTPIVEADLTNCASGSGRLLPTYPTVDPIRIAQFDMTPLIDTGNEEDNEEYFIAKQAEIEDILENGVTPDPTVTATSLTASELNSSSTTLDMIDAVGPMSFSPGDIFVVHDGGTAAAIVKVLTATDNAGGDPPYDWSLGIELLVPPATPIAIGGVTEVPFSGFTNAERVAKSATDPNLDPLMDGLIDALESYINSRISKLDEQITSLGLNEDPDLASSALTNCNTSRAALVAYLVTTDISDTGLGVLSTERGVRSPQVTARIAAITAAYTGGTINYLDSRYNAAKDRANTIRGTIVIKNSSVNSKDNIAALKVQLQASIDSITAMLAL